MLPKIGKTTDTVCEKYKIYETTFAFHSISGLDPALPLYTFQSKKQRLCPSDAAFVDIIHTDGGVLGLPFPMGHADFFPNGGVGLQPGCVEQQLMKQQWLGVFSEFSLQLLRALNGFLFFYNTHSLFRPGNAFPRRNISGSILTRMQFLSPQSAAATSVPGTTLLSQFDDPGDFKRSAVRGGRR